MWNNSEKFLLTPDHHSLHLEKWTHPHAQGSLLIVHGQGEHSGSYERFINYLKLDLSLTLNIYAFDFRGHGRSEGLRGFANHPIEYVEDLETALSEIQAEIQNTPLYILAHSMGALVWTVSQAQKKYQDNFKKIIRGQILSSPFFGMSLEVPRWKTKSAVFINNFLPRLTLSNEIKDSLLTEDPEIQIEFQRDPLRHQKISAGVFLGFFDFFAESFEVAKDIQLPTLLFISQTDPVVSFSAAHRFFEALGTHEKNMISFTTGKHELLNDLSRLHVYKSIREQLIQWSKKC